ncbi:MAG: hypothetical protein L0287_06655 [Anaerolineae bacterium]|nr:hypothetical protein [Anaerolineae bacterium]
MSKRNSNHAAHLPSPLAPLPVGEGQTVPVELTEEEIKLLMQMVNAMSIQGNLDSLPQMLNRLVSLQEKLAAGLKN